MDADTREGLERLRRDVLDAVRTSGAEIRRDLAASEARMVEGIAAAEGRMGERLAGTEARMVEGIAAAEGRMGDRVDASARETRRHFDVVAEAIRADVRMVAEGVVMVDQKVDRLRAETIDRFDRVDRRLLTLELRVSVLERR